MTTQELFQHSEICWTIIIIILNFIMARRAIPIIAFPRVRTIYVLYISCFRGLYALYKPATR